MNRWLPRIPLSLDVNKAEDVWVSMGKRHKVRAGIRVYV